MKNLEEFKKKLAFYNFKVVMKNGENLSGRLASANYENKIIRESGFPVPLDGKYICLINDKKSRASYLLVEDIEKIELEKKSLT